MALMTLKHLFNLPAKLSLKVIELEGIFNIKINIEIITGRAYLMLMLIIRCSEHEK